MKMANTPEFNQMISQYVDQIEELFDYVEGESDLTIAKTHSPGGSSSASPALTRSGLHSSTDGDFGVHRAKAPTPTKCFLMGGYTYRPRRRRRGGGWGGDGGKTTVNILNSVGVMTSQIINASANAAAVILPPVAQGVGVVIGNLVDGGKSPPQQPASPQGQWVWNNGKWEWVPAGQPPPPPPPPPPTPPPPPPPPPPPQQPPPPQGQWVWHNGQWVWVPAGQQPPPGSQVQPGGGNATATATSYPYQYQPGLTRSKMPQRRDEVGKPGKTNNSPARSLNYHPATQKGCQEIDQEALHTLQEVDKSVDRILSKLD